MTESANLPVYQTAGLPVCPSAGLPVCPFAGLPVCLPEGYKNPLLSAGFQLSPRALMLRCAKAWLCLGFFLLATARAAESPLKSSYEKEDWDSFFGQAYVQRLRLESGVATLQSRRDFAPLILELTGLLRHCQLGAASQILKQDRALLDKSRLREDTALLQDLKALDDYLSVQDSAPVLVANESAKASKETRAWPIESSLLARLRSGSVLPPVRIHVRNQCAR